jgi:hypothetical protein
MFESLDIEGMSLDATSQLRLICEQMLQQTIATNHHEAYAALAARLRLRERQLEEAQRRTDAAIVIQRAVRTHQEQVRAQLERQTKAAIKIQALFRGHLARKENQLGLLREEQRKRVEEQLRAKEAERLQKEEAERQRLEQERLQREQKRAAEVNTAKLKLPALIQEARSELRFTPAMPVTPPMVNEDTLALVGRLQSEYAAFDEKEKTLPTGSKKKMSNQEKKKLSAFAVEKQQKSEELTAAVHQLATLVRDALSQQRNALLVTLPPNFTMLGDPEAHGPYFYPTHGYLAWGGDQQGNNKRRLEFHPNRSLVHVRDEVTPNGTHGVATAYLASLIAAAMQAYNAMPGAPKSGKATKEFEIAGTTDRGKPFTWTLILERSSTGTTLIHADTGYEYSHWRPQGSRGLCVKCGESMFNKPNHRKRSGNGWTFSCQ